MNKYSMYIKERENVETYEDHRGFFTYKVEEEVFQVNDLFIIPSFRRRGVGKEFAKKIEEIAKEFGSNIVYCSTCIDAINWEQSHSYITSNGYEKVKEDKNMIYYKKEL